jgi:DNA-binding transcriptional MerR regulator
MTEDGLRSGEVADAAGVNVQTLRFYERRGLLQRPDRTLGGHRLYPPQTVTVIRVIKAAQRLGFTLDEVSELLEVGRIRRDRRPADLQIRAKIKMAEIDAKLTELSAVRDTLRAAVDAGCVDLIACADSASCPVPFTESSNSAACRLAGCADGDGTPIGPPTLHDGSAVITA